MANSDELRKLAEWYREFAERAGNPAIWEARLQTAQELEAEADRQERWENQPWSNRVLRGQE